MNGRGRPLIVVALAVFVAVAWVPLKAEVGAFVDPTNNEATPIVGYVFIIVDGPEPFGASTWQRISAPEDPTKTILNEEGYPNGDGPPYMVHNAISGQYAVVWSRNSASGFDVVLSQFVDGEWTEPEIVAGSPDDEMDPVVIVNPADGSVHLFYWVDDATPRVVYRVAPADLSSWSAPEQVSDPNDPACRPYGTFHDGILRVVYEVHSFGFGETPRQVVLARKESQGFTPEIVAMSYQDEPLWPQVHSGLGRLWIDWIETADDMAWIRLDSQGQWEATRYETYSSLEDREFQARNRIRMKAIRDP